MEEKSKGEIAIYKSKSGPYLDVRLEKETVWLSQKQMASLFGKDVKTVNEHIKNIYKEKELKERPTIRNFRIVQKEGVRKIEREVCFYNLDVIISVGYRVKSESGTQFRIWATRTLKKHLLEGYTIDKQRLSRAEEKFDKLREAVFLLQKKSENNLIGEKGRELLDLLADYSKALAALKQYGKEKTKPASRTKSKFVLDYWKVREAIGEVKREVTLKKEADDSFGRERGGRLKGILEKIYQKSGKKEKFPSLEEKASCLLYSVIKEKPFFDGNKRIGSFLFVYLLEKNGNFCKSSKKRINGGELAVLSLLISASSPKEREKIIGIIIGLLASKKN
ncbi:MAG: virulence protein RhuM/Fic/DOC family protein [Candidatus Pacebacteria bacterium]|nr:virulence protein RhuM/Fic/DOC family protein [Candidatus Paceibacterota bacterium]MDD4830931.1 virulence protein RhuM/Fic/DOC family protein [Candidatus Paceibacterota bacterium]MDD4875216.1 virulence protein RhuM/Fic/DOC family protein [Candidatus Paceibacterota bacterium]